MGMLTYFMGRLVESCLKKSGIGLNLQLIISMSLGIRVISKASTGNDLLRQLIDVKPDLLSTQRKWQ